MLLKNADELKQFSKGEEDLLEQQLAAIRDTGANVIVSGLSVFDVLSNLFCGIFCFQGID